MLDSFFVRRSIPAFCILAAFVAQSHAAEEHHPVKATIGSDFKYTIGLDSEHESYRIFKLTYPSPVESPVPQNNTIPAELYLPRNLTSKSLPRPAVICLHILGGGAELTRLQCTALAARGIPAIWLKLPYYGERGIPGGTKALAANPSLFAKALDQGVLDVRRTVDLLASRPDINPRQISVAGVSMGGILAARVAAEEPRIYKAALILAGGDLFTIIHHARETRILCDALEQMQPNVRSEVEKAIRSADPLEHAAALRKRAEQGSVIMINAAEDEVIPRECTEKLADALGIRDRVVWLDGLGHYTAMTALSKILDSTNEFFGQDLPADAVTEIKPKAATKKFSGRSELIHLLKQLHALVTVDPAVGHTHSAVLTIVQVKDGKQINGRLLIIHRHNSEFAIKATIDDVATISLGQNPLPWMATDKVVFRGILPADRNRPDFLKLANQDYLKKLKLVEGLLSAVEMAPEILDQWVTISDDVVQVSHHKTANAMVLSRRNSDDNLSVVFEPNGSPVAVQFKSKGLQINIHFEDWHINGSVREEPSVEPHDIAVKNVSADDLARMWAAAIDFAGEMIQPSPSPANVKALTIVGRDPDHHGLLCTSQGKRVLIVSGSSEQMGAAQGHLLREPIQRLMERVVYGVGAADSMRSGEWWFDRTAEIERRTSPHMPPRFMAECDALAAAAGVSTRDARAANLFPERFHCSGVALCGKATADGRILHARVLDYMRDIGLQSSACVSVFMPDGRNAWISAGYAGFLGTVTAMNERGLAVGEMGGRGEGNWDGVPMTFLLRDIMERASTVDEALKILRETPRTCEYYYVFSDKSRAMAAVHCDPKQVTVLRAGEQHPLLPHIPEDTVLVSGDQRAKVLSERIEKSYGHIDVHQLMEIIKRPVAMNSNLHDAIFSPETLDLYIADAGRTTPACDEPYAKFNLAELLEFYRKNIKNDR